MKHMITMILALAYVPAPLAKPPGLCANSAPSWPSPLPRSGVTKTRTRRDASTNKIPRHKCHRGIVKQTATTVQHLNAIISTTYCDTSPNHRVPIAQAPGTNHRYLPPFYRRYGTCQRPKTQAFRSALVPNQPYPHPRGEYKV